MFSRCSRSSSSATLIGKKWKFANAQHLTYFDNVGCLSNYCVVRRKQGTLHDATLCIASRTRQLSRLVTRHYENALRGSGLTIAQFSLLVAVAESQPIAPVSLARLFDLEKSSLSRNLRLLIEARLLVSGSAKAGGQALLITPLGLDALDRALPNWKKAQTQTMDLLGNEVVSKLDEMIAAMARRM